ncbi:MAG: carboxypeptidase regulatory-like domain-containing protein [DPANN group archaeon]|nr:carboxypeptidase regulatory-like domain-containing protein [DPANN group archaeon]
MDKRLVASLIIGLAILAFIFAGQQKQTSWTEQQIPPEIQNTSQQVKTGIHGTVTLTSGDCMPGEPSRTHPCTQTKISRTVYIREPATIANMDGTYLKTKTNLVAQMTSDSNGYYDVTLPAGTYSVFVEDGSKEYCNFGGGLGEECQVTVTDGGMAEFNIDINKAVY